MIERPILFSAPMVRAIQAGVKTQTRRVVKPQPETVGDCYRTPYSGTGLWLGEGCGNGRIKCPYGQPGDRLWVRETYARDDEDGTLIYRADVGLNIDADMWEQGRLEGGPRYRWRPSIHMPRWASRITLDVVSVRVERVQDISEADAVAEGCNIDPRIAGEWRNNRDQFEELWDSIHGPGAWDRNDWVWVVAFKRV